MASQFIITRSLVESSLFDYRIQQLVGLLDPSKSILKNIECDFKIVSSIEYQIEYQISHVFVP